MEGEVVWGEVVAGREKEGGGVREEGCTEEKRTLVADRERLKIGRKVGCVYNKRSENELGAGGEV